MPITHSTVVVVPDDGTSPVGTDEWNANHVVTTISANGGTVTASTPVLEGTQTWNAGAVTFTGFKLNVTDTSSAAESKLADLQVGGNTVFKVTKVGAVVAGDGSNLTMLAWGGDENRRIAAGGGGLTIYGSATGSVIIDASGNLTVPEAASVNWSAVGLNAVGLVKEQVSGVVAALAQRDSTNAQTYRLYNTYTDASNWERVSLGWSGNVCTLKTEKLGTGTNRELNLVSADNMRISASSYVIFQTGAASETARVTLASGAYECGSSGSIGFGSSAAGTTDTALSRNAAGVVEVNNGSAGTFRDLRLRNIIDDNGTIYSNIPQNSQSAAYTLVLADANKHILHPAADTTARTFTIPANGSVAYPIGTAITFVNQNAAGTVTIAITTDTMRLAGAGTTGSRTLAANGIATAIKITSTEWIISGTGLT